MVLSWVFSIMTIISLSLLNIFIMPYLVSSFIMPYLAQWFCHVPNMLYFSSCYQADYLDQVMACAMHAVLIEDSTNFLLDVFWNLSEQKRPMLISFEIFYFFKFKILHKNGNIRLKALIVQYLYLVCCES